MGQLRWQPSSEKGARWDVIILVLVVAVRNTKDARKMRITVPGFRFAGVKCGIKESKKRDLALVFSDRPATAAAIFTTNQIKAAAVLTGMKKIRSGKIQAVVINSGNANACTGARGVGMRKRSVDWLPLDFPSRRDLSFPHPLVWWVFPYPWPS